MPAKVIQVIEVDELEGHGTEDSPYRRVLRYFSFDGEFLAERDRWLEEKTKKDTLAAIALAEGQP